MVIKLPHIPYYVKSPYVLPIPGVREEINVIPKLSTNPCTPLLTQHLSSNDSRVGKSYCKKSTHVMALISYRLLLIQESILFFLVLGSSRD